MPDSFMPVAKLPRIHIGHVAIRQVPGRRIVTVWVEERSQCRAREMERLLNIRIRSVLSVDDVVLAREVYGQLLSG